MTASPLWKYFFQDKTFYKTDKTHKNAWCHACLAARKRVITEMDLLKIRGGLMLARRSDAELENAALACVDPVAGKAERMKTHIKQCKNMTDDQRTLALLSAADAKAAPRLPLHTQNMLAPSPSYLAHLNSTPTTLRVHVRADGGHKRDVSDPRAARPTISSSAFSLRHVIPRVNPACSSLSGLHGV